MMSFKKFLVYNNYKPTRSFMIIFLSIIIFFISISFLLYGLRSSIHFYKTPSQITNFDVEQKKNFRLAGFVRKNSVSYEKISQNKVRIVFDVEDSKSKITVLYQGILPNLFREGQEIVSEGFLKDQTHFIAKRVLAKHDENYKPEIKFSPNKLK